MSHHVFPDAPQQPGSTPTHNQWMTTPIPLFCCHTLRPIKDTIIIDPRVQAYIDASSTNRVHTLFVTTLSQGDVRNIVDQAPYLIEGLRRIDPVWEVFAVPCADGQFLELSRYRTLQGDGTVWGFEERCAVGCNLACPAHGDEYWIGVFEKPPIVTQGVERE